MYCKHYVVIELNFNEWILNDLNYKNIIDVLHLIPILVNYTVEHSSGPAAQYRHHLRTVQTTAEGMPFFQEAWTRRSVTYDMRRLRNHLLTYATQQPKREF